MLRKLIPERHGVITLLSFSVLFALLSFLFLYIAVVPVVRPYTGLVNMFLNSTPRVEDAPRDLFATSAPFVSDGAEVDPGKSIPNEDVIPVSAIVRPRSGDLYGRLTIEGTSIDAPIYWDDTARELNAGVGTYVGGWLPGYGRTVMMAAHRNTYFSDLGSAEIGGVITVETHYETYTYEIINIEVKHMEDDSAYDFTRNEENIILYTCYPFKGVGARTERYFVYGKLLSGRLVDRGS